MNRRHLPAILLVILLLLHGPISAEKKADPMDRLTEELRSAGCISIDFVSIVTSDIFESVDSVSGTANLARDGRFHVRLGDDWFVQDSASLTSYNSNQHQVTIEQRPPDSSHAHEVTFLTRLDQWFDSRILQSQKQYHLRRKRTAPASLPDSLSVWLSNDRKRLERFTFRDENGDVHTIVIQQMHLSATCKTGQFLPAIPAGADIVRLP